jgi:nucleotide-binding universal stress UspA family protein
MTTATPTTYDYDMHNLPPFAPSDVTTTYARIVVLLDGSAAADRAISTALNLAETHHTEIVLVCTRQVGARDYIHAETSLLQQQGVNATGHIVRGSLTNLPDWMLESHGAQAIVVGQKATGWLGRFFSDDVIAALRARTHADIFAVTA